MAKYGLTVKVFEVFEETAGTWCVGRKGSALYDGLRTNLPTGLMQFWSFQWDGPSVFVKPKDMNEYINRYAVAKDVGKCISFNTRVQAVERKDDSWIVTYQEPHGPQQSELFDAVIVANGHFNVPLIPDNLLAQIPLWKGKCLHSKDYIRPETFRGLKVLLVGGKSSGTDIAKELDGIASEIHVCDTDCPEKPFYIGRDNEIVNMKRLGERFYLVPGCNRTYWRAPLKELVENSSTVKFQAGPDLECDVVIFCTGYKMDFPFLSSDIVEIINSKRVRPIYNEVMHAEYPTLFFAALNQPIVPFPFVEMQMEWAAKMLVDPSILPSREARFKQVHEIDQAISAGELTARTAHIPRPNQFSYMLSLAKEAKLDNLATIEERLYAMGDAYKRVGASRPIAPGQNDDYRDREIRVNWSLL
mmetsp:Transcript_36359/g.58290  ORF Transcript_36359/g.58290 Transcript_36359/m.58290 type:complete len:416 (-) Transcript_36359:1197-2444(-)